MKTMNDKQKLNELRKKIDVLDSTLLKLLAERQSIVQEVIADKLTKVKSIRDHDREEKLLRKIREMAVEVNLDPYYAEKLFRDIIFQSVRYQTQHLVDYQNQREKEVLKVAFHGDYGSFSHQAAQRHYNERSHQVEYLGYHTFDQAAHAVESEIADVGILPIDNTSAGSINETYTIVGKDSLYIIGEEVIRVKHCLAAVKKVDFSNIRRILAHPLTIIQCQKFLSSLYNVSIESFVDSGLAARKVFEDADLSQAALISPFAAQLYNLDILESGIADHDEVYTRFVLIGKSPIVCDVQLPSKVSLLMTTVHEQGALINCLKVFEDYQINMTKLESRPRSDKPWQYQFYIDIDGNTSDLKVTDALNELSSKAASLKILGCYPKQIVDG